MAACSTSSPTPPPFGLRLTPEEGGDIVRIAEMIKAAAREQLARRHPGTRLRRHHHRPAFGPPRRAGRAPQECGGGVHRQAGLGPARPWTGVLDRSPCGTGTCASMAALHAKGSWGWTRTSSTRASWAPRLPAAWWRPGGPYPAVVPTLAGPAWITGFAHYVLDPDDPFPEGFTVADPWG